MKQSHRKKKRECAGQADRQVTVSGVYSATAKDKEFFLLFELSRELNKKRSLLVQWSHV